MVQKKKKTTRKNRHVPTMKISVFKKKHFITKNTPSLSKVSNLLFVKMIFPYGMCICGGGGGGWGVFEWRNVKQSPSDNIGLNV